MSRHSKYTKNISHEYISTKQHQQGIWFRLSNYFVLLSMLGLEKIFDIQFSDYIYMLVFCAILGYDISGLMTMIDKFIGRKKKA